MERGPWWVHVVGNLQLHDSEGVELPCEPYCLPPTSQMKTWSVALVLCLNIGVDPPDVVKTEPCARKECWIGE